MRRRGTKTTDEELDAMGAEPRPGDVWWCDGAAIGMNDGAKTRPVLVVRTEAGEFVAVVPLTSRKPADAAAPVRVAHRGGLSWFAGPERSVRRIALLSSLGRWPGFDLWRRGA